VATKKVDITDKKSKSQVMEDSKIKKLAQLGIEIEKHYGCPQDIEWCEEKDELYIVSESSYYFIVPTTGSTTSR